MIAVDMHGCHLHCFQQGTVLLALGVYWLLQQAKGDHTAYWPCQPWCAGRGMKEAAMGRFRALHQVTGVMQLVLRVLSECCWVVRLHTIVCVFRPKSVQCLFCTPVH
jgi:hypothetical protein